MDVGEENSETKIKTTPDNELEPTSVDLVVQLGEDYAEYVNIDTAVERKKYADTVDEMLTKLDEFCGLVDMIRSDTALCLTRTVPEIHEKCHEMEQIFTKIDKLEAFVALVRRDVGLMEDHVTRAEDEMGTLSGIRKILGSISMPSFISPKKSAKAKTDSRPERDLTYRPPEIFDTDKFFPMSSHTSPVVVQIPGKVPIEGGGGGLT